MRSDWLILIKSTEEQTNEEQFNIYSTKFSCVLSQNSEQVRRGRKRRGHGRLAESGGRLGKSKRASDKAEGR